MNVKCLRFRRNSIGFCAFVWINPVNQKARTLRAILLLLTTLVFAVVVFCAGLAVTAHLIAEPEPHRFAHLDTPLWTSKPVAIDPATQNYERIAAIPAIASLPPVDPRDKGFASFGDDNISNQTEVGQSADTAQTSVALRDGMPPVATSDPAHTEWCFERYRSYNLDDNSYQPYGGGPRAQCESPWTPIAQDMQANVSADHLEQKTGTPSATSVAYSEDQAAETGEQMPVEHAAASAPAGAHEEWCYARYRSYRVDDNSYQPFDGGPRRACSSPYG
jgi:hypothetical protein